MKSVSVRKVVRMLHSKVIRNTVLTFILGVLMSVVCGCSSYEQPGETAAEGRRRHQRVDRINRQELMADIDTFLLLDEPSRLSDKRIP